MRTNPKKSDRFRPVKDAAKSLSGHLSMLLGKPPVRPAGTLVRPEDNRISSHDTAQDLPNIGSFQPFAAPHFFALVDMFDPSQVHYYGVDVGTSAFTVRCGTDGSNTNFGHWNSMESAFARLNQFAGPDVHLALISYDSVPVMARSAIGGYELRAVATQNNLAIGEAPSLD